MASTSSDLIKIFSQYSVSRASLREISSLLRKSLSDCADRDSCTFAPIEVPDRNNWFPNVRATPGRSSRKLQALMMRIANSSVLSVIGILDISLIDSVAGINCNQLGVVCSTPNCDLRLATCDLERSA